MKSDCVNDELTAKEAGPMSPMTGSSNPPS
jgi:hypothetical protein